LVKDLVFLTLKNSLKVSIILPAYNAGDSLLLAVESIRQQTLREWELILLDDGSSDGSIEKIRNFNDNRIRIYSDNLHRGLSYRLNQGISLCRSKYIARMDADDICFMRRFELQFNFLQEHPAIDLVATKVIVFNDEDYSLIRLLPYKASHDLIIASPWRSIPMPHSSWMGRAEWFKRHLYKIPEVMRAEDQELLLRSMNESKFHTLPELLLAYRRSAFNFQKKLTARVSLLKTQIFYFNQKKQYSFLCYALLFFLSNVFIDFFAVSPKFLRLFFSRMISKIPGHNKIEFELLIKMLSKKIAIE
jgi:glycosyltransferase involved in cell wall biosynthesis